MLVNVAIKFPHNWFSLRTIDVLVDGKFHSTLSAIGNHSFEINHEANEIIFQLGKFFPYRTKVSVIDKDKKESNLFVVLHLNYRGLILSLYDSLKPTFLQSKKTTQDEYEHFIENGFTKEIIHLKDSKASVLMILISLVILIFSIVQQANDLAPFAFLIGLSSLITSLVYFREKETERNSYKSRMIASILLFLLALFFLENSYLFLHWIVLSFTTLLTLLFIQNINHRNYSV
ncbi:hypothetical protein AB4865_00370 [Capnocytophaga sp. ARDL2]|uniref:hypothetical protein n=1 Tax=Capnocytophaga sp. ARDL2 TaxID=3238809 RepID=UPI0035586920